MLASQLHKLLKFKTRKELVDSETDYHKAKKIRVVSSSSPNSTSTDINNIEDAKKWADDFIARYDDQQMYLNDFGYFEPKNPTQKYLNRVDVGNQAILQFYSSKKHRNYGD